MMNGSTRIFQYAVYLWVTFYLLAILLTGDAVWSNAPVQLFRPAHGVWRFTTGWEVDRFTPNAMDLLVALTMIFALLSIRRHRWWLGLVVWLLFRVITHRTWLASNGGVQLMENMLIWAALMGEGTHIGIRTSAFWIARLQLLIAYAAAAVHKFTGTTWLDGSAVMMVANDPGFSLGWLARSPGLCTVLTYATLGFMTLFSLAIWWSASRRAFLMIGVLFHLSTAVFLGIPQMGLAFIACYAIWLDEQAVQRFNSMLQRIRSAPLPAVT